MIDVFTAADKLPESCSTSCPSKDRLLQAPAMNCIFGMFACDANNDGIITAPDFNLWNASTTAGETGYLPADCNLDGIVTAPDFNLWNANTTAGAATQVPE